MKSLLVLASTALVFTIDKDVNGSTCFDFVVDSRSNIYNTLIEESNRNGLEQDSLAMPRTDTSKQLISEEQFEYVGEVPSVLSKTTIHHYRYLRYIPRSNIYVAEDSSGCHYLNFDRARDTLTRLPLTKTLTTINEFVRLEGNRRFSGSEVLSLVKQVFELRHSKIEGMFSPFVSNLEDVRFHMGESADQLTKDKKRLIEPPSVDTSNPGEFRIRLAVSSIMYDIVHIVLAFENNRLSLVSKTVISEGPEHVGFR